MTERTTSRPAERGLRARAASSGAGRGDRGRDRGRGPVVRAAAGARLAGGAARRRGRAGRVRRAGSRGGAVGRGAVAADLGRREVRAGRSLDALLCGLPDRRPRRLAAAGRAWAWRRGWRRRRWSLLAEAIFAYVDELSAESAEGFAREQAERAGELERRRRALAELLVATPAPDAGAVAAAADAAHWRLPATVVVAVWREGGQTATTHRAPTPSPAAAPRRPPPSVRGQTPTTPRANSVACRRGLAAALPALRAARRRAARGRRRARVRGACRARRASCAPRSTGAPPGSGPPCPLAEAARSFRLACAALALAEERGVEAPLAVDAHRFDLLSRAEPSLVSALAAERLSPLGGETVELAGAARGHAAGVAAARGQRHRRGAASSASTRRPCATGSVGCASCSAPRSRTPTRASSSSWCCGRDDRRRHRAAAVAERAAALPRPRRAGQDRGHRRAAGDPGRTRRSRWPRRRGAAMTSTCARTPTTEDSAARIAIERLRFVLSLDDDLEPFHRAHRCRPAARPDRQGAPEAARAAQAGAVRGAGVGDHRAADRHPARRRHRMDAHAPPRRRNTRSGPWCAPTADKLANAARARGRRPRADPVAHARARRARGRPRPARPGRRRPAPPPRDPRRRRVDARAPEPVRARALRRAAGQGRRDAQRLRAGRRRAHRQRHRGGVRRRSSTASARCRASRRCTWWRRDGGAGRVGHNHRMPYVAAEDRYDSMPYRRCGRSGIKLPAISLGLWNRFGDDTPIAEPARRSSAARSISASPTSTWPTTTARPTARPRATSAGSCARTCGPTATS